MQNHKEAPSVQADSYKLSRAFLESYIKAILDEDQRLSYCPPSTTEREHFIQTALAYNLNPYLKEIYFVPVPKYSDRQIIACSYTTMVSYYMYIKQAQATGSFNGVESKYIDDENGKIKAVEIIVHKKDAQYPFKHIAFADEYNLNTPIWQKKPRTMLHKVALTQALRIAFQIQLPYIQEEYEEMEENTPLVPQNTALNLHEISDALRASGLSLKIKDHLVIAEGNTYEKSNLLKEYGFGFANKQWSQNLTNFTDKSIAIFKFKPYLVENSLNFEIKDIKDTTYISVFLKPDEEKHVAFLKESGFSFYENKKCWGIKV